MTDARKARALKQRLLLSELTIQPDNTLEASVIGSTGTLYTVSVGERLTCTCMDHTMRHAFCKHMYFVALRVLRLQEATVQIIASGTGTHATHAITQLQRVNAYRDFLQFRPDGSQPNMCRVCKTREPAPGLTKHGKLFDTCCRDCALSGGTSHALTCVVGVVVAQITCTPDEDCPICLESFRTDTAETQYRQCGTCNKFFHTTCLGRWSAVSAESASGATSCPMCRSVMK